MIISEFSSMTVAGISFLEKILTKTPSMNHNGAKMMSFVVRTILLNEIY
jgi:hypothetical protein